MRSRRLGLLVRVPAAGARVAAVVAAAGAAVALALAGAPVASAAAQHAILVTSTPDNGSVVKTAPRQVLLTFSESVETAFGAVRVYDPQARRVDTGKTLRPAGDTVGVALEGGLADGTHTVTWRVISADSHPVHGAFVFSVGKASGDAQGVAAQVQGQGAPRSVEILRDVVRGFGFALLLLVAGGVLALVALVPGDAAGRRLLWLCVSWTAALLVPLALAGIVLQGASAGGFGIGHALRGDVIATVLDTRFGKIWLGQAAGASAIAIIAQLVPRSRVLLAACAGLAGWLVVTPGAAGHAQATSVLAFAADAVHVAAASVWIGGLAAVVLVVAAARADRLAVARAVVPRLSTLALGSVAALVVAGAIGGYLQVRAWHALWDTRYGVLLLVKIGLVLAVLALGAANRLRSVPALAEGSVGDTAGSPDGSRRFLRTAGLELAVAAAVVGVTAVLVATPPARTSSGVGGGPVAVTAPIGPLQLNLTADPARTGPNAIHIYLLKPNGQPASADEAVIKASLPSAGIGPLTLDGTVAGPGHFVFSGATLPLAGRWSLRVEARQGEFTLLTATVTIPVRRGT